MYPVDPETLLRFLTGLKIKPLLGLSFPLHGWEISEGSKEKLLNLDPSLKLTKLASPSGRAFAEQFKNLAKRESGISLKYKAFFESILVEWKRALDADEHDWYNCLLHFPRSVSSIVWAERYHHEILTNGNRVTAEVFEEGSPYGFLKYYPFLIDPFKIWPNLTFNQQLHVLETLNFVLIMIGCQLDVESWNPSFDFPKPSRFFPAVLGGEYKHPMWMFFDWLRKREEVNAKDFVELANMCNNGDVDTLYHWTSFKDADPSVHQPIMEWGSLHGLLNRLEPIQDGEILTPFRTSVYFGFALARMTQAHVLRCKELGERYFYQRDQVHAFYSQMIIGSIEWGREYIPAPPWLE